MSPGPPPPPPLWLAVILFIAANLLARIYDREMTNKTIYQVICIISLVWRGRSRLLNLHWCLKEL